MTGPGGAPSLEHAGVSPLAEAAGQLVLPRCDGLDGAGPVWLSRASAAARGPWVLASSGLWVPAFSRPVRPAAAFGAGGVPAVRRLAPPTDDLRVLGDRLHPDAVRLAALDRVVAAVPWHPPNPDVRRALEERALGEGCSVAEVKQRELRAAVYLALAERRSPRVHRFGRVWLTDQRGHAVETVPEQLPPALFWRWFADEVRKAAEASVLGRAYPVSGGWSRRAEPWDHPALDALPGAAPDPLFVVVRREERVEAERRWREVLAAATPRQQELLGVLAEDLRAGAGAVLGAAARRLGLAPSTARVQWKRLVDRHARPGA